jgi:uncharacterized protein (DUF2062 family)
LRDGKQPILSAPESAAMPRKVLKRILGRFHSAEGDHRLRRLFGEFWHNPDLWHLNRYSVAWGVSVGLFFAFMPVPFQMPLAAAAAIVIGCNLPISLSMVWVTNPVTMPPLFYAAYKTGAWTLGQAPRGWEFELSVRWLLNELGAVWQPFLLGCFVLGLISAVMGHIAVRIIWRIHVSSSWRERRRRREAQAKLPPGM